MRFWLFIATVLVACKPGDSGPRVVVLGFDGMDYALTTELMSKGRLPYFAKVQARGQFGPLETSIPPQSPVAWSNFITGKSSGTHGIYDFIHRDAQTMTPFLSTSRTTEGSSIEIGDLRIPISGGKVELLRHGQAFWEVLAERGIETSIMRMPANFPPSGTATHELSGMGTPDVLGTYGTFTLFTTKPKSYKPDPSGGRIEELRLFDGAAKSQLVGPENPFSSKHQKLRAEVRFYVDAVEPAARIEVGSARRVLAKGEWSDWIDVEMTMIPTQTLRGIVRFYVKSVRPELEIYASPIDLDPLAPALPITTPEGLAKELAEDTGRFYTQGMPEDTKALSEGVLDRDAFLEQAKLAGDEVIAMYEPALERFDRGFLFYYFGNVDLTSHMFWRARDPGHPGYDRERDPKYSTVIEELYEELDAVVGRTLERLGPDDLLVIMSDHGFTSWRREFHLNSWLRDQGYLAVKNPEVETDPGFYQNVNWTKTRAYALGLNGLYVNLRGREQHGVVDAKDKDGLLTEISDKLLAELDPATGKNAVTKVYRSDALFSGPYTSVGPDVVVGYAKGTRGSNESALGTIVEQVITDNLSEWSGDHAMDHETVPGILLATRRLEASSLLDLSGAILKQMGIEDSRSK
ncbi:MAG: alkaline phosphatase family protein [Deltaproteobacteria bacterium]|nr:alkaline phosphatase family protein [Deltaproteobacteria bacterium]